jgi:rod shape-determining protein MreC
VDEYQVRSIAQAQKLQQIEYLQQENRQLRELLALRPTVDRSAQAAQILYDTTDGYVQRLIIDKGQVAGIRPGAVVIDTAGLVGQVTRVHPLVSEVTRLTDREQSTPVMNARTGDHFVAFGESAIAGDRLELRFVPASADMRQGDLLITSGLDGIYPPGLHVGQIVLVDRRVNSSFARVLAAPVSREQGRHLLVLQPMNDPLSQAAQAVQAEQGKSP